MAYGQTGSGKTFTMEGTRKHPGIIARAVREFFGMIEDRKDIMDYEIKIEIVEIYNEKIRDLLQDS